MCILDQYAEKNTELSLKTPVVLAAARAVASQVQ